MRGEKNQQDIERREKIMPDLTFKAWLVQNRITQKEISELLGISAQSVCKKVNGQEDFSMEQARKICGHYNCSAEVFIPSVLK